MQWLIHIMEVVLFGLIGCLIFNLVKAVKAEKQQGVIEVSIAPRKSTQMRGFGTAPLTESIKQLQLFWSTQLLEMRLEGFKPDLLKHPALNASLLDYLQGASNAVADFYECNPEQRLHLQSYLLSRGLKLAKLDYTTGWLQRLDRLATYENTEIYNAGYQAASQWVSKKQIPKERSLLKSINGWGLVA